MTLAETRAYNAGIMAVLNVASAAAESIGGQTWKPTRAGAAGALEELAEAAQALLIGDAVPDASGEQANGVA